MPWAGTPMRSMTRLTRTRDGETVAPRTRLRRWPTACWTWSCGPGRPICRRCRRSSRWWRRWPRCWAGTSRREIADTPVPAELARALAQGLGLLPASAPRWGGQPPRRRRDASATEESAGDAALAAADEAWWAEVEARALRGEWGGREDPPPEELGAAELSREPRSSGPV